MCAYLVATCAQESDLNLYAIRQAGWDPTNIEAALIDLAKGGTEEQKERAAAALWNLACNADNQRRIAEAGSY